VTAGLIEALIAAGIDPEPAAAALWLVAASEPAPPPVPEPAAESAPPSADSAELLVGRPRDVASGPSEPVELAEPAAPPPPEPPGTMPAIELSLPAVEPGRGDEQRRATGTLVALPAGQPYQNAEELVRALRRFRRLRRPTGAETLDLDATVEATADASRPSRAGLVLRTRRTTRPALDVVLVVDTAPTMIVWRDLAAELGRRLGQLGAFRGVASLEMTTTPDGHTVLVDPAGRTHPPERLVDPSGGRLVLLLTDAVDPAWYQEDRWAAVDRWARAMPTVLLQTLPADYWRLTGVGELAAVARGGMHADRGNVELQVRRRRRARVPAAGRSSATALPVVALTPTAVSAWVDAVLAGTRWVGATFVGPPPTAAPTPRMEEPSAAALVTAFEGRASAGARRVARLLAVAPVLTLPLIRVIQNSLASHTGDSELAEILVSGLLEDAHRDQDGVASDIRPELRRMRFRAGVGPLLLRTASELDEWALRAAISAYLAASRQQRTGLLVVQPDPAGTADLPPDEVPFADLLDHLDQRLRQDVEDEDEDGTFDDPDPLFENPEPSLDGPQPGDFQDEANVDGSADARPDDEPAPAGPRLDLLWSVETTSGAAGVSLGPTYDVAFSPDGTRLATASADGTVTLWDAVNGRRLSMLTGGRDQGVHSVAFSPDGAWLVTAAADRALLWDVQLGLGRAVSPAEHADWVSAADLSPDGRLIATASHDRTIAFWDVITGRQLAILAGHTDWVSAVAFSPDGGTVASAGADGTVRLWDAAARTVRRVLEAGAWVNAVAFSPDGRAVAGASADGMVRLWDVASRAIAASGKFEVGGWVGALAFSPDGGLLAAGGSEKTVGLWDPWLGGDALTTVRLEAPVMSLDWHGDRLACATQAGLATLRHR